MDGLSTSIVHGADFPVCMRVYFTSDLLVTSKGDISARLSLVPSTLTIKKSPPVIHQTISTTPIHSLDNGHIPVILTEQLNFLDVSSGNIDNFTNSADQSITPQSFMNNVTVNGNVSNKSTTVESTLYNSTTHWLNCIRYMSYFGSSKQLKGKINVQDPVVHNTSSVLNPIVSIDDVGNSTKTSSTLDIVQLTLNTMMNVLGFWRRSIETTGANKPQNLTEFLGKCH